jgi:hypothetical protein
MPNAALPNEQSLLDGREYSNSLAIRPGSFLGPSSLTAGSLGHAASVAGLDDLDNLGTRSPGRSCAHPRWEPGLPRYPPQLHFLTVGSGTI